MVDFFDGCPPPRLSHLQRCVSSRVLYLLFFIQHFFFDPPHPRFTTGLTSGFFFPLGAFQGKPFFCFLTRISVFFLRFVAFHC